MAPNEPVDVLVFAPHPDDAELGAGGLLLKLKARGCRTAIVDLTRGELGTKGDPETRAKEAAAAADVLAIDVRMTLDLGDGRLKDSPEQRRELIIVLRTLRPRLVLTTHAGDLHPDHQAAFQLVQSTYFLARLPKIETGQPFHAPTQLWTYGIHCEDPASFVVDISAHFAQKRRALQCYRSQFTQAALPAGYRYVAISDYLELIELRARYWGQKAGTTYAEAFSSVTPLRIDDPFGLNPSDAE